MSSKTKSGLYSACNADIAGITKGDNKMKIDKVVEIKEYKKEKVNPFLLKSLIKEHGNDWDILRVITKENVISKYQYQKFTVK